MSLDMESNKMFVEIAEAARKLAELCEAAKQESQKPGTEAWRERNRRRQAAGVMFQHLDEGKWRGKQGAYFAFTIGKEEDYREVKTKKYCMAMMTRDDEIYALAFENKNALITHAKSAGLTIIGNIEDRDVPVK